MTGAEWLGCDDPEPMLGVVAGFVGRRKLILFACACFRRVWGLLSDNRSRRAVEIAESFVDGSATESEFAAGEVDANAATDDANDACCKADALYSEDQSAAGLYAAAEAEGSAAYGICYVFEAIPRAEHASGCAASAVQSLAEAIAIVAGADDSALLASGASAREDELREQAEVLRDLIPSPHERTRRARRLEYGGSQLSSLAAAAYGERILPSGHLDPARLAVLSDALEEAGCTDPDILSHLRSPGPHVRGCWALDLVLADCR